MSYLGSWKIDDLLTFTIVTHTVTTGAATDADSAPSYRIYEDETSTPILTGTMALLDSGNTAGFYSEQITLSAANGFEKGKSYNIYIQATVNSIVGATTRNLQIEAEVDANSVSSIGAGVITAASIATNAIDADALAADALAEIQTSLDTAISGNISIEQIIARLEGLVMDFGGIGDTGNDTTHVHIPNFTYGNDEINNHLLIIYDVSENEFHARWIEDWVNATKLATVATLPFTPQNDTDGYRLLSIRRDIDAGWVTALTESYRATNAQGTPAQLLYELIAHMGESSISSTTKTLKKLDGSTTAKTYTLDSATVPTSITEAT